MLEPTTISRHVGRRIRGSRRARGLMQGQLAASVGVAHQTVSKWERGDVTSPLDKMVTLARFFAVSLDYFVEGLPGQERIAA